MTDEYSEVAINQIAAIYRYQHPQTAEWLLVGNQGSRPCRFENWSKDDLISFVGGPFAKAHYTITEED